MTVSQLSLLFARKLVALREFLYHMLLMLLVNLHFFLRFPVTVVSCCVWSSLSVVLLCLACEVQGDLL